MKKWVAAGSVLVCTILTGAGLLYVFRAGLAQIIYYQTKYDSYAAPRSPSAVAGRCAAAHRLYPHNYYFSIWTSERAWHRRLDAEGKEIPGHLSMAQYWCEAGLEQNFYSSQLRLLKTRLLERESPARAAAYWQDYVNWQFWKPHNHFVLVELYAKAGDFPRAMQALDWVKGSPYHASARQILKDAWEKEMRNFPSIPMPSDTGYPEDSPGLKTGLM